MKEYVRVNIQLYSVLISALDAFEWSESGCGKTYPDVHWIGGKVMPNDSEAYLENLLSLRESQRGYSGVQPVAQALHQLR